MNLDKAIKYLNNSLNKKQPKKFNDQWIKVNLPGTYKFIRKNIKTIFGDTDWDLIVSSLERHLQKRWAGIVRNNKIKSYSGKKETGIILRHYHKKMYTFITSITDEDKYLSDTIIILLVRIAQKGNISARAKIIFLVKNTIENWMEKSPTISRWTGYNDRLEEEIQNCIRRYRYTGSFLGYLYRTLYYIGRSLPPICKFSFDEYTFDGKRKRLDVFIGDNPD